MSNMIFSSRTRSHTNSNYFILLFHNLHCTRFFFYTQRMLSLHQATEDTKKLLKWLGISVGIILFLVFAVRFYQFYSIRHAPPPPPTMLYGELAPIPFPQSTIHGPFKYTIETVSGFLPDFPDREPVYKIVQPQPD